MRLKPIELRLIRSVKSKKMQTALRLTIVTLLLAGLLLGLEFSLRQLGYASPVFALGAYKFDPELGWALEPNQKIYRSTWAYAHFTHSNALGESSGSAHEPPPSQSGPQTALLGDSFVEGFYVSYQKSFAYLLSRFFTDSQTRNLGVSGYGPEQYLLAARRRLPGLELKRTLLFFYAYNDLPYLGHSTLYGLYAKPALSPDLKQVVNAPLSPSAPSGLDRGKHLPALVSVFLPSMGALFKKEAPPLPSGALENPKLKEEQLVRALAISGQVFREFPSSCDLIAYVPAYEEFRAGEIGRNKELFLAECQRQKLKCLWPENFTASDNPLRYYYSRDNQRHFNEEGSEAYFEAVRAEIVKIAACANR